MYLCQMYIWLFNSVVLIVMFIENSQSVVYVHIRVVKYMNMLKLNDKKTGLMLVTSKRTKHLHSLPTSITIGNAQFPSKSL